MKYFPLKRNCVKDIYSLRSEKIIDAERKFSQIPYIDKYIYVS